MSVLLRELNLFSFTSVFLFLFGWFTANLLSFSITSSYLGDMGRSLCADCHPRWDTSFSFFLAKEMHFHLFFKMAVSRCNKPSKDLYFPHVFLFLFFLLALLIKMASSPSYLLEAPCLSPVFPTLPSPSPCQMKGLFWAEAGFTPSHSHYLSCVSCHRPVCPLICMDRCGLDGGGGFFCFVLF